MKYIVLTLMLLSVVAVAHGQVRELNQPTWSTNEHDWRWVSTNDNWIVYHWRGSGSDTNVYTKRAILLPFAYKDADSGLILFVERDGRHVTAINPDGKILWSRDPFADAHLEFYRTKTPRIAYIGPSRRGGFGISIAFDSSQFGRLDIKTGTFSFEGND
jgi:hypothetical protein